MVLGKNKGHRYEDDIFELLEKMGLLYPGTTSDGMAGGVDAVFCHFGKPHNLEVKNGLQADYGQKKFKWSKENGWDWSEHSDVTGSSFYLKALKFVQSRNITPRRYTIPKDKITVEDGKADQREFEYTEFEIEASALWSYYAEKDIHYIQVGDGYGFYHLDKDVAKLGTAHFDCNFILRFRGKYHDTVDRQGGTLAPTPWNYSFFAVLKVNGKPKRSRFNLEPSEDQEFPPIKP